MVVLAQETFQFGVVEWLAALWVLPLVVAVLVAAGVVRRRAVRRFVEAGLLGQMNRSVSGGRRIAKGAMVVAALGLATVALARPRWDPAPVEVGGEGRDVCFIIDVSRSMLAEDVGEGSAATRPSRLERTKVWMMDVARSLEGDRVGLVAFGGTSVVKCPLTHDYGFFRLSVDELSPTSVSRGGTMIGDAVRLALNEVFDLDEVEPGAMAEGSRRYRDIILITDGEDQGSLPLAAAERAGELGVRLITIGVGSPEGQEIPYVDGEGRERVVRDASGAPVISKLDSETLEKMARATPGGVYLEVADGTIELDEVYTQLVRAGERNEAARGEALQYREGFQYFLAAALGLLIVESLVSQRKRGVER